MIPSFISVNIKSTTLIFPPAKYTVRSTVKRIFSGNLSKSMKKTHSQTVDSTHITSRAQKHRVAAIEPYTKKDSSNVVVVLSITIYTRTYSEYDSTHDTDCEC